MRWSVWAWRVAFVAACALQLYGVYAPEEAGPGIAIPGIDKVAHFCLFAAVAFTGLKVGVPARWLLGALVVNAIGSEFIQHYLLPHRDGDPYDALADLLGVAAGAWAGFRVVRRGRTGRHDMMGV
ncbi:VanZ family protein [Kribbella antibiotica]|uniref:VanZ family protein n=1 Tax=Kribbella antibiotica TaxID=190195 RepID=A0A4R4YL17_9ACTN|nr:VanZ family protein [Kribbella antibiotica]TDD45596.1 VanZ family protein [Kribbella antibiotica]